MLVATITHTKAGEIRLAPKDVDGNPVTLPDPPQYSVSEDLNGVLRGDLFPAADGLSCVVPMNSNGLLSTGGVVKITYYQGEGDGVETKEDFVGFTSIGAVAVDLGLSVAEVDKPPVI